MLKKLLKSVLALGLIVSLGACSQKEESNGGNEGEKEVVTLKVWGSQDSQSSLQSMINAFIEAHPEKEYNITLGVVGEPDAKEKYLEDPEAAADVFAFANDQVKDLVNAGALYEVTRNKNDITSRNTKGSVDAATIDGKLYGYPFSSDNGYFLYYDKSVISEEQVKSLDGILEAANAAGKKVFMDVSNGWYIASFFLGNGGTIGLDANGKQICDFNNANGLAAAEIIKKFTADPAFLTGDDTVLTGGMGETICAGVSGTWNAPKIQEALGENYAATKLPTMTVDGKQVQMYSFAGYKLFGVNSLTKFPADAMDLADWLSNEENQLKRFEELQIGPSNLKVAESDAIAANVALKALADQAPYSISQTDVLGGYWSPAEAFGTAMEAKDYSTSLQEQLDAMVSQITK